MIKSHCFSSLSEQQKETRERGRENEDPSQCRNVYKNVSLFHRSLLEIASEVCVTIRVNKNTVSQFTQQRLMKQSKLHEDRQPRTFGWRLLPVQYVLFILMRDGVYRSLLMTLLQRYFINIASQHSQRQKMDVRSREEKEENEKRMSFYCLFLLKQVNFEMTR